MSFNDDDGFYFHQRNHYDLNSKIMLTAILSLSVVVLVVTVLHVYARCVLRRQARRRATLRGINFLTGASHQVHTSEPPKMGLDPLVIASLPMFVYEGSDHDSMECSICLSTLMDGEMVKRLPNCKHTFHSECIDKWVGSNSTCPICRTEAEPSRVLIPEPREGVAPPTAPILEHGNSTLTNVDGTSDGGVQSSSAKIGGSSSRLSSFRRILTRERSSQRIQTCGQDDGMVDLERQ